MFPPGAVPVGNLPPEMMRALQASLAEAFQDRDAARRQFFNGNEAVSDDAVDAAIAQFREHLQDPEQASQMMAMLAMASSFAPPPPRDLAMPEDSDSDEDQMPTLEDQDAPVFRPPPPPINDILGPTTEETDSEEYTDEEEADDDVDVEEVERRKRYERALAKFPYQGDLGRAVRAQDREAIRLINRMRTAFETREDTAGLEEEARALVVRKRAETPAVKAPSLRRREQEEKVRKAALLKQRERAAAQKRAEAEAELAAQRERERQEALREAEKREAEAQRRAAREAEAKARREAAAREEAERRGAAERTAEAERLASERDAKALALAAERDAEASAEAARAAAAQRAVHAAKVLKLKCAGSGATMHGADERVVRKCSRGCVELYAAACKPAWVASPRLALNGDVCKAHGLGWSEARAFTRGADWAARGAPDVTEARIDDVVEEDAPVEEVADAPIVETRAPPSKEVGVVWAGPLGQRTTNATASALAKRRLDGESVKDALVADEALVVTALKGKLAPPWEKDRSKLPKDARCCRFRVPGGHSAAKRVARALRGDPEKGFPFKLRAAALAPEDASLLEKALQDVGKAKKPAAATKNEKPSLGCGVRAKGGAGGRMGGSSRKLVGPAAHRPPRQRVGEHPLYKTSDTPAVPSRPVAADFPVLSRVGATRRTTAADFPALNGAVWQGPAPSAEDFPATLGTASASRADDWRPAADAPAPAPAEDFPTLSTGRRRAGARVDAAGYAARAHHPKPRGRPPHNREGRPATWDHEKGEWVGVAREGHPQPRGRPAPRSGTPDPAPRAAAAVAEDFPTLSTGGSRRATAPAPVARAEPAPVARAAPAPVARAAPAPAPAPAPAVHVPSPAELLSNFAANQAREAAAREAAERAAAAAAPPPAPIPEPPALPHPWQSFWDARSERYYFGHPTTGQVQWDMPVAAPPPPPPPVRPAYTEASYERLVAELAEVRVRPSQDALGILRRQEVTVEDLCDLTHAMLVAAGLDQIDVHMIWSKIEVLRNRRIARESA